MFIELYEKEYLHLKAKEVKNSDGEVLIKKGRPIELFNRLLSIFVDVYPDWARRCPSTT